MTSTLPDPDVDALAGWFAGLTCDTGWRLDGWLTLHALGLLWRRPGGLLILDGPARTGAADLRTMRVQLRFLQQAGWTPIADTATPTTVTCALTHPDADTPLSLLLRYDPHQLSAIQTRPPRITRTPAQDEMLARRAYLIAALPQHTAAWRTAVIDAAALVTDIPDWAAHSPFAYLPTWITDRARQRLATLDHDAITHWTDRTELPAEQTGGALHHLRQRWQPA